MVSPSTTLGLRRHRADLDTGDVERSVLVLIPMHDAGGRGRRGGRGGAPGRGGGGTTGRSGGAPPVSVPC
jgi:uncharacterized membrane protein YgcG